MSLAVIGATSAIAKHTATAFGEAGHEILLVARDTDSLNLFGSENYHVDVEFSTFQADIGNLEKVSEVAEQVIRSLGEDPYILVAVGSIDNESEAKVSSKDAIYLIDVNYKNLVALITPIAHALEKLGKGCIVFISSVAGDRGRQSNYIYGSAKSGLSTYAQGLRNRLYSSGVHVLTVKPGYIDTPMLQRALGEKRNKLPRVIVGKPDKVGRSIYLAAVNRKNVIYVPPIWRILMLFIKSIPEGLFKKLNL